MKVSIIAAMGVKNQIGLLGKIPFKSDLQRFKYLTLGKTLLMGRKTYESIGRELPGRNVIVLTRKTTFKPNDIFVACTLRQAADLAIFLKTSELMICGGEKIYKSFMDIADRLYLTHVKYNGLADAYFPTIRGKWNQIYSEDDGDTEFEIFDRASQ